MGEVELPRTSTETFPAGDHKMANKRVGPNPTPNLYNEEECRQSNYPSPPTQGNEVEMEREGEQGE